MRFVTVAAAKSMPWQPDFSPTATEEPVGVRHAVSARSALAGEAATALCGVDIRRWQLFADLEFVGARPADCHRCAQLVAKERWRLG